MKFTAPRDLLLNAVLIAERTVGKKESLPVLSCFFLTVAKNLTIESTNLEAGTSLSVLGEAAEKGSVAVPSSVFVQTLRSISGNTVTLRVEGGNLVVEAKGTKTLIKAVPHDGFPALTPGETVGVSVPREALLRSLQSVAYAASPSMIRPELGSVFVALREASIVSAATDSFRLAEKTLKGISSGADKEVLIPLKHAGELSHLLERITDEVVSLAVEDSQLTIRSEFATFVSRIVDATFPNYKEVIPKQFVTEATALKADVADMLRKARVFSGTEQRVGLHVYPKKKVFSATAQSADVGEMSDMLEAAVSGDDIDIFFNIAYLSDGLQSVDSDSVTLSFAGPGRPLVVRGVSDQSFTYLVMPLNR